MNWNEWQARVIELLALNEIRSLDDFGDAYPFFMGVPGVVEGLSPEQYVEILNEDGFVKFLRKG